MMASDTLNQVSVAFAGMTHLGLNSAVAAAIKGIDVYCFDSSEREIAALQAGSLSISEPGLTEALLEQQDRLNFTASPDDLIDCRLVVIAPDIPTDNNGTSDTRDLSLLIEQLDQALPSHCSFIIHSQVPPGYCRALSLKPGRQNYYQVETLIFGKAIDRALNPERFIIGADSAEVKLEKAYQDYLSHYDCPQLLMKYESAELAKIAINCCLVSSISVANALAELCEAIDANWSEIVPALKLDKRIGPHAYLSPGLGIAGGNLERDLNTVIKLASQSGTDSGVVKSWVNNSRYRKDWVLRLLHEKVFPVLSKPKIAILGLAYKQDTHSTKNSASLALLKHLNQYEVDVYDPVVKALPSDQPKAQFVDCVLSACRNANVLIIMTPWEEFKQLLPADIAAVMAGRIIIDPYSVLDTGRCQSEKFHHYILGRKTPDSQKDINNA